MTEVAAQRVQFAGQRADALISRSRIRAGRAGIADRVGQTRGVRVGTGGHGDRLGRGRLARPSPTECDRAPPQRGDIASTEPPSRTGQHPHRGRAGRGVGDQPQHGHHVGDLGDREQAGQADDLDRDSAGAQRIGDRCGVGVAAHQHRGGRRADAVGAGLLVVRVQVVGDPLAFGAHVGKQRATHGARRGVRTRAQRLHRNRASSRLRRDGVGDVQGPRRVAPAGPQLEDRRGGAVGSREVGAEPRQVGRRRAAPAVDRLDRVADGRQRQPVVDGRRRTAPTARRAGRARCPGIRRAAPPG